jgi:hypothetical protein
MLGQGRSQVPGNTHQPQPRMSLGWATRADHRGNPLTLPDSSLPLRCAQGCGSLRRDRKGAALSRLRAAKHLATPSSRILRFAQDDSVRSLRLMPLGRPQVQRPQVQGQGDPCGRPYHTTGRPAQAVYSPCLWVLALHQGHLHPRLYIYTSQPAPEFCGGEI